MKNKMRKILFLGAAICIVALLANCSSGGGGGDSDSAGTSKLTRVVFDIVTGGPDRVVAVDSGVNHADLYWQYTAVSSPDGLEGETTDEPLGKGLSAIGEFEAGDWTFTLRGFADAEYTNQVYIGTSEAVRLIAGTTVNVTVVVGFAGTGDGTIDFSALKLRDIADSRLGEFDVAAELDGNTIDPSDIIDGTFAAAAGTHTVKLTYTRNEDNKTFVTEIEVEVHSNVTTKLAGTIDYSPIRSDFYATVSAVLVVPYTVTFDYTMGGKYFPAKHAKSVTVKPGDTVSVSDEIPAADFFPPAVFGGFYAEPECANLVISADGTPNNYAGYISGGKWAMTVNKMLYAKWIVPGEEDLSSVPAGALPGVFSISAIKKIYFSPGNLIATIDESGIPVAWKFAANQYDYLGAGGANETIGTAAGDIDLFGWSGDSASAEWGISSSDNDSDYSGNFKDWGEAYCESNSITPINAWFTPTKNEWKYLFDRADGSKWGVATITVNERSIHGYVVLPDTWVLPGGSKFTSGSGNGWNTNKYNADAWKSMESAGAVFLPAVGYRYDGSFEDYEDSFYWSATPCGEGGAFQVRLESSYVDPEGDKYERSCGFYVRLVCDAE